MKKKIIFMLINMNIGGTEKALLNMINEFPKDQYEITIFLLEEYGGFLKFIPEDVKVKYFSGYQSIKDLLNQPQQMMSLQLLKEGKIVKAMIILFLYIITKILKDRTLYFKYILRKYPILDEEYDVAVAYGGPMDFISYFVIKKIKAKRKIQWIHFDVTKIGFNRKFAAKIYRKFQKIFVVSKEGKEKLTNILPSLAERTEIFRNIISPQLIKTQAKEGEGFCDNFMGIKILTVGRLSLEKGQDLAIKAMAKLKQEGFNVRWYCVGEGKFRNKCEELIDEYNLKNDFILLGSTHNPYPYIEQCDIYVQPSRHEGFCITLAEAKCLVKPIVTTNFTGAKEQLNNWNNGLIVGIDENEIYRAIVEIITNNDLRKRFSHNLLIESFDCKQEIKKIMDFAV
ncbi:glycosyltransferase [Neobacillus massiliamazoniensis]|uniref:Group 1 glycosyl transferase n=1 Tax=Neobacillus massiliamazoniensis TaxID=1499688 RepID=A0A0U1NUH2_9BACI|nr:glycosyltransferase [Neobacillus massiliamazoniensis]CRK81690.1 group 1 glycosyl transferase [Neobacillus massiliamazoniensis]